MAEQISCLEYKYALELAKLGAGPKLIESQTGIPRKQAYALAKEHAISDKMKSGQSPNSPRFFTRSPDVRYQASILAATYVKLMKSGFSPTEVLIEVARFNNLMFSAPLLDVNQIHALGRLVFHSGSLTLLNCDQCGGQYLADPMVLNQASLRCPFGKDLKRTHVNPEIVAIPEQESDAKAA